MKEPARDAIPASQVMGPNAPSSLMAATLDRFVASAPRETEGSRLYHHCE